jgi:hypothetical protein
MNDPLHFRNPEAAINSATNKLEIIGMLQAALGLLRDLGITEAVTIW